MIKVYFDYGDNKSLFSRRTETAFSMDQDQINILSKSVKL